MGTLLAQQGNAAFSSWASSLPRMGRIGFWYLPDTFIFSEFSQRMRFLPSDNSSHQKTIQTIGWQSRDSQLSVCQNITTKNQMVWQFFAILGFTENQATFTTFTHIYQHRSIPPTGVLKISLSTKSYSPLGFDKILTLGNVNKLSFLSLNRIFG